MLSNKVVAIPKRYRHTLSYNLERFPRFFNGNQSVSALLSTLNMNAVLVNFLYGAKKPAGSSLGQVFPPANPVSAQSSNACLAWE